LALTHQSEFELLSAPIGTMHDRLVQDLEPKLTPAVISS
jgi:hypothetical protein